jgi:hypothetical protein
LLLLRAQHMQVSREEKKEIPIFQSPDANAMQRKQTNTRFAIIAPAANPPSSTPNCSKSTHFVALPEKFLLFDLSSTSERRTAHL